MDAGQFPASPRFAEVLDAALDERSTEWVFTQARNVFGDELVHQLFRRQTVGRADGLELINDVVSDQFEDGTDPRSVRGPLAAAHRRVTGFPDLAGTCRIRSS
ncbi:hypothetical protein [Rhodococcus erythropolis]|uniref:hypothetical protein n=1 Tax=Rhodococcus erythropolis TaxID=1833 RepID=UPI001C9A3762|nr:hypothetical protein [Rhodococcus erythropolis]